MISKPKINPAMMKWARKNAGFINGYEDELPNDIKTKYLSWESGEKQPTWNQLRKVSKKYNLPSAFFFIENVPPDTKLDSLINYRKINPGINDKGNSPNLIKEIWKAKNRRKIYIDLSKELNEEIKSFKLYNGKWNKYNISKYMRNELNITLKTQQEWIKKNGKIDKQHYNFLNKWKENITEKMNILIFETEGVEINEMRALCLFYEKYPVILLNGKDSVNGRIFSLFHEITHLLKKESAICDDTENNKEEIFCNAVAGEFLVPKNDLINKNKNIDSTLSFDSLNNNSHTYGVSKQVILRRLYDTKIITKNEYKNYLQEIEKNTSKQKKSGGSYFNNQMKYNGEKYCSLILNAYEEGLINSRDFTKYTGIKKKSIPQLYERLYGGEQ